MPTPTAYEYAQLARHVYDIDSTPPAGWTSIQKHKEDETGLQAAAYERDEDHEVVISVRGTVSECKNWVSGCKNWFYDNSRLALGTTPASVKKLEGFLGEIKISKPESRLSMTGHSLGAALATIVSWKDREVYRVTTFDSVATGAYTRTAPANLGLYVNSFLTTPNAVSITGSGHTSLAMAPRDSGTSRVLIDHGKGDNWYKALCVYSSIYRLGLPVGAVLAYVGVISPITFGICAGIGTMIGYPDWLAKQHSISGIEEALAPGSGVALRSINHWQSGLVKGGLLSWGEVMLRGLLPFHPANPGFHTIANYHAVTEERIRRIPGYVELRTEPLKFVDRVLSYDTAERVSGGKMA